MREAGAICKLVINPTNPAEVFVAALGHPFGKNPERGIFRTRDGGATWQHVMALNDRTGSVSIVLRDRACSVADHPRTRTAFVAGRSVVGRNGLERGPPLSRDDTCG